MGPTLVTVAAAVVAAFGVSPRPGSIIIRWAFNKGGKSTNKKLAPLVPDHIAGIEDISYADAGHGTTLDVWFPESVAETTETLPTIVWIHGGGWVAGDKSQIANYLKTLASHGFTVIGINYSLAPDQKYPKPVHQTNQALAYIKANAARLHADTSRIVLAGDSAGAHIAAQVAAITTSSSYASEVGVLPSLQPSELVGTVLNCGPYVPPMVRDATGLGGWFVKTVAWAYIGTKDFDAPVMAQADLIAHTTASFPPAWISGGNNDPLTAQGKAFATHLSSLGVDVETLFYATDHKPALGHEYQFDLTLTDSKRALAETVSFLHRVTSTDSAK